MKEHTFEIEGMTCGHCKMAVEMGLKDAGFKKYSVEIGSAKIGFSNEDEKTSAINAIEDAGYKVTK